MDQKKKIRVVVIIPVVVTLLVLGGVVTMLLIAGSVSPGNVAVLPPETAGGVAAGLPVGVANAPGAIGGHPDTGSGYTGQGYEGDGVPPDMAVPSCAFDFLIGQTSDQAVAQVTPLGRPYRVLTPGAMVTQDYSAERINLTIDENGMVQSVDCG